MKISYNWLRSYLDIAIPAEKLAELLTSIGLEVEGLSPFTSIPGDLEGVVVGEVIGLAAHPDADRLRVASVNVGSNTPLQIVCGAPNVAENQKVAVVLVGSKMYSDTGESFEIKKTKLRGVVSEGMICSAKELNVGEDEDGILVLDASLKPGESLKEVFDVYQDEVFEIGLTANRSDAMCHFGVARDILATLNCRFGEAAVLVKPSSDFKFPEEDCPIAVKAEHPHCSRYMGLKIVDVKVGPSPDWLKNRLLAIGQKSINNVVDVSNYVLHEYGQPLHIFDADKIKDAQIRVKKAGQGEKFITLDHQELELQEEDLLICDSEKALCLAGVYGGATSGVTDETINLFIESACFDSVSIRRSSLRHQLRTEAAIHFEKGCDPNQTDLSLQRCAELILACAGGKIEGGLVDIYPEEKKPQRISMSLDDIDKLAGMEYPETVVDQLLQDLGLQIEISEGRNRTFLSPLFKSDVSRPVDVTEEVMRIFGFEVLPDKESLRSSIHHGTHASSEVLRNTFSEFLSSQSWFEAINLSIGKSRNTGDVDGIVPLLNSMNADLDVLRFRMLDGLLENVAHNLNHKNQNTKLYEFGLTYKMQGNQVVEKERLAMVMGGKLSGNWLREERGFNFFDLKEAVFRALAKLGLEELRLKALANSKIFKLQNGEKVLGELQVFEENQLQKWGIKSGVYYADLDWGVVKKQVEGVKTEMTELNRHPSMKRDLAILVNEDVKYDALAQLAWQLGGKLLKEVGLFDVYEGKGLEKGKKSYGLSYIFEANDRTLKDKEVDKVVVKLREAYQKEFGAEFR